MVSGHRGFSSRLPCTFYIHVHQTRRFRSGLWTGVSQEATRSQVPQAIRERTCLFTSFLTTMIPSTSLLIDCTRDIFTYGYFTTGSPRFSVIPAYSQICFQVSLPGGTRYFSIPFATHAFVLECQ